MEGYSDEGGEEAVYMCVLDFEATCDNDGSFNPQEIIEVWLPIDTRDNFSNRLVM